jgi:hypothetical protein
MCAVCRKVKSDDANWRPLEDYVMSREKDRLAQEVCPECAGLHGEATTRR